MYSGDGTRWRTADVTDDGGALPALDSVAWGGGRFVAVSHGDSLLYSLQPGWRDLGESSAR